MKLVIRIVLGLTALVVLVVAGAGILLATFNPNNYTDRIEQAVKESTGRDLEIAGNIETSFFPVLGFKVNNVTLGNPPGFEKEDTFASIKMAQAGVSLIPLLSHRIEVSKVVLSEPRINVIKKSNGATNLSFKNADEAGEAKIESKEGKSADMALSVEAIEIQNAEVTYTDKQTGKTTRISPLNLTIPGFTPGADTSMNFDLAMTTGTADQQTTVKANGSAKMKATPGKDSYELSDLKTSATVSSPSFASDVKLSLNGSGSLNTRTQRVDLTVPEFEMSWQDTQITGNTKIAGDIATPTISFSAHAPSLNIDNVMAGLRKDKQGNQAGAAAGENSTKQLIPVDLLRGLTLDGDIKIDELVVTGLKITDISAPVSAVKGKITINPVTATFYEGRANVGMTIDARQNPPVFTETGTVKGVEIGPVLVAKMGDDYVTGKGDLQYDLRSQGNSVDALKKNSGGSFGFKFADGYINKWQLSRILNQAIQFIKTGSMSQTAPDQIRFTSLDATFRGQGGTFRNDDFVMIGPEVHAIGSGTISLSESRVDYGLRLGLGEDPSAGTRRIPIAIRGPLSAPTYTLDTQALLMETAGEKIEEKKEELIGKALEKITGKPAAGADEGTAADPEEAPAEEGAAQDPAEELIKNLFSR